jgi:hypothetical protein
MLEAIPPFPNVFKTCCLVKAFGQRYRFAVLYGTPSLILREYHKSSVLRVLF